MNGKKIIIISGLLIAISVPLTLSLINQQLNKNIHAAAADKLEAEGGVRAGNANIQTDGSASGGQFISLGITTQSPTPTSTNISYDAVFTGDATGATDVTSALQSFFQSNNGRRVALAVNGIYKVNRVAITVSNITIDFRGSHLQQATVGTEALALLGSTNVTLNDPSVFGTGYSYTDPTQFEHGIDISGGSNITINHPVMRDLRGDGIYIGTDSGNYNASGPSAAVVINNSDISRTGRNGISPVAGEVTINGGTISHSGLGSIDFEPNNGVQAATIKGIVNGVDMRTWGDLIATSYAWSGGESFAIAAGGSGAGTKQYINVMNCTGDKLRMGIWDTSSSTVTGNVSDIAKTVSFTNVGSVTFSGNTRLTRQ